MTRKAFGKALGRFGILYVADHKRVVADDRFIHQGNIRVVTALQLFDTGTGHLNGAAFEHARLLEKPGKARRRPWPGRQRCLEGFPLLGAQPEVLAVGQGFFSAGEGALQNELATLAAAPSPGLPGWRGAPAENSRTGRQPSGPES